MHTVATSWLTTTPQQAARVMAEEDGNAIREAEERAKAKAAEAALAAAVEAEEAKRRWKEEVEARKQEKRRKQQELEQAAAQLKATGMGATTRREVDTGDMPVPLGLADALDGEGGGVAGGSSRFKAMLAVLFVALLLVASALAGAVIASVRLQHRQIQLQQQLQQPVQVQMPVAVALAVDDAKAAAAIACPPASSTASHAGPTEAPNLETVEAHEAALAVEAEAAGAMEQAMEQAGTTWAEAAMAMVMKVTHRSYTRTPLYYAGGEYYAELVEVVQQERKKREEKGEDPLAEMLADEWAAWAEAAGHEEWDAPRFSLALSSARVVTTTPIRPKKRSAPSVNKGALALKWERAQASPSMQYDPKAGMVLERRFARIPRRRPLALRVALAPLKLAVAIIKLPFRLACGVLKVVTWPIRAMIRA